MDSKKHLPGRIVPLGVLFPGNACGKAHVRTVNKGAGYKTSGDLCYDTKTSFVHRPNILLRKLAFGFTQSDVHIWLNRQ